VKSYSETINDRARRQAEDTIVMHHTNINAGEEPKMAFPTATGVETDAEREKRTGLSSVRITDDESKAVQKTPHRVSLDSILAKIAFTDYHHPVRHPHMTVAVVTLNNGYIILGKSVPADPENYDPELGQKFAYEDAIRQIWPLEAYLLREKLSAAGEYGKVG